MPLPVGEETAHSFAYILGHNSVDSSVEELEVPSVHVVVVEMDLKARKFPKLIVEGFECCVWRMKKYMWHGIKGSTA